jgi:hypothetical protein
MEPLKQERADLQLQLQTAATPEKAALATKIKQLTQSISDKKRLFDACVRGPADELPDQPLDVSFTGIMSLTKPSLPGTPPLPTNWTLRVNGPRTEVYLRKFESPPWRLNTSSILPSRWWLAPTVTTVSLRSTVPGLYFRGSDILLFVDFELTLTWPWPFDGVVMQKSVLSILLTTRPTWPLPSSGAVFFSGGGVCSGGEFHGTELIFGVTGNLMPPSP